MSAVERAATERAAESANGATTRHQMSGDRNWWWNGGRWVAAVTEDGLWRWDGSRWKATVELEAKRPDDLATTLTLLAERCYADAGAILADRASEWGPEHSLRDLVSDAQQKGQRLRQIQEDMNGNDAAGGRSLLGRRGANDDDRRQLGYEREALTREYQMLVVRLGRNAPRPSLKEADDRLFVARLLEDRAGMLTSGLAEVDEAERMRADAAVAAQQQLTAAENTRLREREKARKAVEGAEAAHATAVSDARQRLRAVLTPGAGELKGGVGPLRLHDMLLETPSGRMPAAGAKAYADRASALWSSHREVLHDVVLLQAPESEAFRDALADRSDALFLLLISPTGIVLWPCPQGHEKATWRFAEVVNHHAQDAARVKADRDAAALKAEEELESITRDRSSVQAAESELGRVEADPELLGAIDEARGRLERARADTPELNEARRKLLERARRVVAPPDPLKAAGDGTA